VFDKDTVVVDTSATDSATLLETLISVLNKGGAITMANKKILTGTMENYDRIVAASGVHRLRHESSVGAGTPVCATLLRLLWSGDNVRFIQGAMSGTLGYISSELQKKLPFSEIVRKAKELGYTEPDPRDDLSGMDVARKALILSRMVGIRAEMSDINVVPLYPSKFASLTIEEFMNALPELDDNMAKQVEEADSQGKVLRFVASIDVANKKIEVGFKSVDKTSALGMLSGSDNMVTFETDIYSPNPLVLRGYGAGAEVTAAGCIGDIVELSSMRKN
jgi:homoserine dehydrogenase